MGNASKSHTRWEGVVFIIVSGIDLRIIMDKDRHFRFPAKTPIFTHYISLTKINKQC